MKTKAYFNWSSGKDASLALHHLQKKNDFSVDLLVTSVNGHHDRVSMHGLRRSLLEQQVKSIGIPLRTIELPEQPSMDDYNEIMNATVKRLCEEGHTHAGFGDIFLEDLRSYREDQLKQHNIECVFPLWKKDTKALIEEFVELGFKAKIICASDALLGEDWVGRDLDESFLRDLPSNVDPCGENGEFHTFCYDGPIFSNPIDFSVGEKVLRKYPSPTEAGDVGFWFCDLVPIND